MESQQNGSVDRAKGEAPCIFPTLKRPGGAPQSLSQTSVESVLANEATGIGPESDNFRHFAPVIDNDYAENRLVKVA